MELRSLVIFPGALGDFVCFLPALERIARSSPVDLWARGDFAPLAPPGVAVGSLERIELRKLFVAGSSRERELRNFFARYEHVYSWLGSAQAVFRRELLSATGGSARLFAFRPAEQRIHQADYYLSCLGGRDAAAFPSVRPTPATASWCDAFWEQNSLARVPVLAMAPGSGAREKNWPVGSFESVARWWRNTVAGVVLTIMGPVEEERGGYPCLSGDGFLSVRGLDLGRLSGLLLRSTLYLGNDSGISHLAAALGVPTAVLFGPSNIFQWAPRGAKVSLLQHPVECSPCTSAAMKACAWRRCLEELAPAEVIARLTQLPTVATLTRKRARITVNSAISPESAESTTS